MKFIEFCVRHAVPVIVAVLLALLFGVVAILGIPRQLTPEVEVPVIGVTVRYLGAAPQEIEREIVNKIEKQLNAVEGVREMTSSSAENSASLRLEFDWGVNLDTASIDVINKLNLVRDLPDDADEPVLFFGEQFSHPVCFISLKGKGETSDDLREFAEDVLEPELKRISGVSRVEVYGGRERQVEAVFDPYRLALFQLTPLELSQILAAENANTRGGRIEEGKNRWVVRTVGEFRTAEDVENVLLRRPGMADVRMRDLVKVNQKSFKDAEAYVRIDGQPGIVFAVYKKTGENVVEIVKQVYQKVDELNAKVLARMNRRMTVVYNEAEYIDHSIGQLQTNVILCAVLAGAVLVLFLRDVRAILTIFVTIPISFISTFIFLWMLGRTLNVISLAGLAFAVGLLVDNAIVVLENIYRHRRMGKSAPQAALDGAGEVWGAVLASTLTTVAVFVPILLIQEEAGQLFRDIALAIAISVSLSLIVSLTVIPMLTAKILQTHKETEKKEVSDRRFALRRGIVRWFLRVTVGLTGLMALVCLGLLVLFVMGVLAWLGAVPPPAKWMPLGPVEGMVAGLTPGVIPGVLMVAILVGLWFEFPRLCLRLDERYKDEGEYLGLDRLRTMDLVAWSGAIIKRGLTLAVHWLMGGVGRRLWVGAGILAVFGYLLVFFARVTPVTYLPLGNRNFVFGFVDTEAGSSVEHNLLIAKEAERRVQKLPGVERFFIVTLGDRMFFGVRAADADEARALVARISAALGNTPPPFLPQFVLKNWFDVNGPYMRQPIAGVRANVAQVGLFQRRGIMGGQQISVVIRGDDINRLYAIAGDILGRLSGVQGVNFVLPSFKLGNWELRPTVDRKRASDAGMTARDVGYAVGSIVSGFKVADFREADGNELDLTLRGAPQYREHIEQLANLPVWTPRGRPVPLGELAPVELAAGFNVIDHTEQQRSVELTVVLDPDVAMGAILDGVRNDILNPLKQDGTIPPEYLVDLRGTARDLDVMLQALKWSLILALIITYLLMAALFESFAHPFVIMLSVPLAIVGGYMMLWGVTIYNGMRGIPPPQLDVVTMLGFVILIGIVVNNAILVVHQALHFHRRDGLEIRRAIVASVESRIRPIFMSTLTSITAMLPLVLRPGPGTELYQGLGSVVVGGLAVSTVFTLILTPVLFSFGYGITERLRALAVRMGILVPPEEADADGAQATQG
ncbi:MAG: efflux RND transporter permease subunit [Phycisphaerae bacterium]